MDIVPELTSAVTQLPNKQRVQSCCLVWTDVAAQSFM